MFRTFALSALAAALLVAAGCKPPPPESIRVKETVTGPPDLTKRTPAKLADHAYQLRAFHVNHVWAGATPRRESARSYRAKVTLWDYAEDESVVAELYFDDDASHETTANPDPAKTSRPYAIHFPMSAFGPILGTLRGTNEPVFLYYYDGAWALGTYVAEPVGID